MKISMFSRSKGPSEIVLNASFFTIFFGGLRCNSLLSFELSGQAGICLKQLVLIGRRRLSGAGGRQLGWGEVLARRIVRGARRGIMLLAGSTLSITVVREDRLVQAAVVLNCR